MSTTAALAALLLGGLIAPQTASATNGSGGSAALTNARQGAAAAPAPGPQAAGSVRMSDTAASAQLLQIRAVHSGKCMDVQGASPSNGADVFQWDCLSSTQYNQQWYLEINSDGIMRVRAAHSGKCLDVQGASHKDAANVFQWDCLADTYRNQRWFLANERVQNGRYTYNIIAQHSGKCLDVAGASHLNGANVFQWTCLGDDQLNQRWSFHVV
ncbi:RICIN domain-containing protein [Streptomyces sp. 12297]|uniref:RICIN domain-containing protein n=1 Tax=Streptomyces sp. NBC_00239 TaxID=2903640 RepID=UPI002E29F7FA|nr:RICIN domain-containing protein [Streptomyces sp. NBC_00239]